MRQANAAVFCVSILILASAAGAQTLETETALLLSPGAWKTGAAYEYQTSSEGTEAAAPLLVEYGLAKRLELVIEPILYTAIRPDAGRSGTGAGDLEATLVWRFHDAGARSPAFALAGEIKAPTARNELIGTRKTDYALYGIATRRFGADGRFDAHANVSYTVVGRPAGIEVKNLWGYALAGTFHAGSRFDLFGELTGNTSATAGGEGADAPPAGAPGGEPVVSPELAGNERVATLGLGFLPRPGLELFGTVSYDNLHATLLRIGYTWRFR